VGQLHVRGALPPGKQHRYPLCRGLGGPKSKSRNYGERKFLGTTEIQTQALHPVALRYTDSAIPASGIYGTGN
jgi:hypothetical protein